MPQAPQAIELPKRLPLVVVPANRDDTTSKDSKLVNCYVEKEETGEIWVIKRPGLLTYAELSGDGYGTFNWKGDIYAVFGTLLYKNGSSLGTVDATGGVYRFSSCLGTTPKMQLGNGVKAYNYDATNGLVQITDTDFPTSFVKGWAYLDGTTYVVQTSAQINGSEINDPTSWSALNTLIAQIEPDGGVALAKQLVYVIVFKQWTTEVFYDQANATGSPLGTVQGAKVDYGCLAADSVQEIDGTLFWLATNRSSSVCVVAMNALKAKIVSTKAIEKLLDKIDYSTIYSWQMKHDGHTFYVVTVKNANLTLAFDLKEGLWHQWTDVDGNYFPIVSSTYDSSLHHILQHETNGKLYYADSSYLNDDGSTITVDIYTPNFDAGVRLGKLMNRMRFIADQVVGSTLLVRKNDHDYDSTKWSNFRKVDLSKREPMLTDCGTFSRRAHNFRHQSNTKFRIQAVELTLDLCTL